MEPPVALRLAALLALSGCAQQDAAGRSWVGNISFHGNRAFSDRDIRRVLATKRTGWWPLARKQWFDPDTLEVDLRRIEAFYRAHGYFDARVTGERTGERSDGGLDIVVAIDEGKPTRIGKLAVTGLAGLEPRKQTSKLLAKVPLKSGEVFDHTRYQSTKLDLQSKLKELGYAYAKVDGLVLIDRTLRSAEVEVTAEPGPRVRFGAVHVEGNGALPADEIEHRIAWEPNEVFHPEDLATTQGRLYQLGVFSSVKLDIPPEPSPSADVTIHVIPGPLRELRLGGGFGAERLRNEVRLRAEWTWRNFLGGLRTLRLRLRPAYVVVPSLWDVQQQGPASEDDLQLTQPNFLGTSITAQGLVGYDLGINEGYQYHGPRGQLAAERPFWHERVLAGASWNLQYLLFFHINERVFNPATTPLGFGFKDPYRLAWLEEFAQLDLRDRPLKPRYGGLLIIRFEEGAAGVGSDFSYFKITPDLRAYLPLGSRALLAARGLIGWLDPSGIEDSPITRRFALGGPSSHRGFGFGRLSPQVLDPVTGMRVPVGGNGELLLTFEGRFNLFRVGQSWIGFVPFVDMGDVTPRVEQLALADLHVAVGGDLEYATPLGPVRAGLGVRLNRLGEMGPDGLANPDPGDRLAFHLTIGEAF